MPAGREIGGGGNMVTPKRGSMCLPAGIAGDAVAAGSDACGLGKVLEESGLPRCSGCRQYREARCV